MNPTKLAAVLNVSGRALRDWLREEYPRADAEKSTPWGVLPDHIIVAARAHFAGRGTVQPKAAAAEFPSASAGRPKATTPSGNTARERDADYIIQLCSIILGEPPLKEHRFDWLRGDGRDSNKGKALPVDAYFVRAGVVVEYLERQHFESVGLFNRPTTVSGITRDEQRRRYDQRRAETIPLYGLRLVNVPYSVLAHDRRGRLRRDAAHDRPALELLLAD